MQVVARPGAAVRELDQLKKLIAETTYHVDHDRWKRHQTSGIMSTYVPTVEETEDVNSQHDRLAKNFGYISNDKNNKFYQAIDNYTNTSKDLNKHLIHTRGEPSDEYHHITKPLDTLFENQGGLSEAVHAYSGTGSFNPEHLFTGKKKVLHLPAYTSTSIAPSIAHGHVQHPNQENHEEFFGKYAGTLKHREGHLLHFALPKYSNKAIYIAHRSMFPKEKELLINRNSRFKLVNHEVHENNAPAGIEQKRLHVWSLAPYGK